jgi:predicted small lipoprotein YifL
MPRDRGPIPHRAAAPLAAALLLALAACGGDGPTDIDPPPTDPSPAAIELDAEGVVIADGGQAQLGATVRDADGAEMAPLPSGMSITWRSEDEAVATVSAAGLVQAAAPGETRVHAEVGELRATAEVLVTQVPEAAVAESGSDQEVAAGQPFPEPLVVRVIDRHGEGVQGVSVHFAAEGGELDPAEALTDADGHARSVWTPEPRLGDARASAQIPAIEGEAGFTGRVRAAAPARTALVAGADQTGQVAEALGEPVRVRVQDAFDNPVEGALVRWNAAMGGGSVPSDSAAADSAGIAETIWTLGTVAGDQRLEALVGELEALVVAATATPGDPYRIRVASGADQTGTAGETLAEPLVVEVTDAYANPIAGAEVGWSAEGGTIEPQGVTDEAGRAKALWTLGSAAGDQSATARIGEVEAAQFSARAAADVAAELALVAGAGQEGEVGTLLPDALAVLATDRFGNPVPGASVSWSAGAGSLTDAEDRTDAEGMARARWTLGTAAGSQSASAGAGDADVTFGATARPGSVAKLETVSGTGQGGEVGTELADPLTVRATDRYGNPVPGAALTWSPGAGSAKDADDATDSEGQGSARWTLGTTAGSQTMTAGAGGVNAAFEATARPGAVAEVRTDPVSVLLEERWQERTLTASAYDRYGNPAPDAALVWTIDQPEIAGITEAGRLRAERRGTTTARATVGRGHRHGRRRDRDPHLGGIGGEHRWRGDHGRW